MCPCRGVHEAQAYGHQHRQVKGLPWVTQQAIRKRRSQTQVSYFLAWGFCQDIVWPVNLQNKSPGSTGFSD